MTMIEERKHAYKTAKAILESLSADLKLKTDEHEAHLKLVQSNFEAANAELIELVANAKQDFDNLDRDLRELAVNHFKANGEKTLDENLSVRINTKLKYDQTAALAWATEKGVCLALDKKAFENVAPNLCPELVETVETPTAVIKGL